MNENIELKTFTDDDIQEYHEIKLDTTLDDIDTSFSSRHSIRPVNEFDFFTQHDAKLEPTKSLKKKKAKKVKSSNLMDIISSEIAASSVPIAENVITFVDSSKEQQNSYLRTNYRPYKPVLNKARLIFTDAESGWYGTAQFANLSPIFPRALQNAGVADNVISVEYTQPSLYDDIIAKNADVLQYIPTKFLDVTIQNIKFRYHHNFTLEKLLCVKVVQCYQEYELVQKTLKDIENDIKVNRNTKDSLKSDLAKVSPSKKESIRFDETVRKYTENVIQLKGKQRELFKHKTDLTHQIISLWSDMEMVRERSDRIDTPYKLELQKTALDESEFEIQWKHCFNLEFTDKLDTIEYEYVSEYLKYKKNKHEQKYNSNKLIKPQLYLDEEAIKIEAEALANYTIQKDQIELNLIKDESIQTDFVQSGLRLVKNSYQFEIYVDDVFVCESEQYQSDDMFNVEFSESFSVQILPKNRSVKITLLENSSIVSDLKLDLAEIKKTSIISDFKIENFVYGDIIEPSSKYVGSGYSIKDIVIANKVRLRSSSIFKDKLLTTCEIKIKVGWNDKIDNQNQSLAIKCSIEVGKQLSILLNGIKKPHLDVLVDVISKIYDKDLEDENMIETLRKLSKMEIIDDDCFSIDQSNPELIRLKLLHLRNIGGFNSINKKLVPLHASQISTEQLNCLQKTKEKELDMDYLNEREVEMDPIEIQRFIGAKYVQKLNKNMIKNLNEYLLQKTHKDVVRESDISLRTFFSNHSNVSGLETMSNSTKQQILLESLCKEQEIRVTVVRAFNLHDRTSTILEEACEDDDNFAGFKVRPLRPFVRISYKGVSAQTVTAIGCHPTWNHTLKITTKLEALSSIHVDIFDECKTQIMEGFSEEDHSSKTVHFRYYNKWLGTLQIPLYTALLLGTIRGTFKISSPPLLFGYEGLQAKESTSLIPEITQLMKKDTSFIALELTTSLSHLGGLHTYNKPSPSSIENDYLIKHLNNFITDYSNEFPLRNISLTFIDSSGRNKCVTQFLQPVPLPDKSYFPKNFRCESAISKSSGLSKSSSSSGRRELDLEKMSQEDRDSVYMGSVHAGDGLSKTVNTCLRYVSLIPCYELTESHVVSLLGLELLKVLYGSPLDHTLLLASYFIYLGIKCWVAVGLGLPRGRSSYVIIKYDLTTRKIVLDNDQVLRSRGFLNKSDGYMWYVCDATTGQKHELRDVGCPLKTVDYVFDNENIWVNRQVSQDCESMSFDFTRSSEWQPVFDKNVFVMKQPVAMDYELYSPPPNVDDLRVTLDTKIKAKVQKWRSHTRTIWNRYYSTLLREMLPQWESWSFNLVGPKPGFSQKLKQVMVTYKIFGFPLNMAYTNTKSVISAVKSTGLHLTDDPKVEFALGVEVCAYPNNVISVWVFLATITRT